MTFFLRYREPGPWQASHVTPSEALNFRPSRSFGTPWAVTWHLTHCSSVWGSATPASAAHSLA
jgi:hypothetical protein